MLFIHSFERFFFNVSIFLNNEGFLFLTYFIYLFNFLIVYILFLFLLFKLQLYFQITDVLNVFIMSFSIHQTCHFSQLLMFWGLHEKAVLPRHTVVKYVL